MHSRQVTLEGGSLLEARQAKEVDADVEVKVEGKTMRKLNIFQCPLFRFNCFNSFNGDCLVIFHSTDLPATAQGLIYLFL